MRRAAASGIWRRRVIGTPNPVNGQHLHDEACEPLWSALEELDVPIGFHPTGNTSLKDDAGRRFVGHANFHPIAHAIRNPVELMGAIASMTTGGILERHPGCAARFSRAPPDGCTGGSGGSTTSGRSSVRAASIELSMAPSEYFKRQCYIALDVDEEPAVDVVNKMGADYFVVSTDYPHSDGAFPEAMEQFFSLPLRRRGAPQDPVGELRPPLQHRHAGGRPDEGRPARLRHPPLGRWTSQGNFQHPLEVSLASHGRASASRYRPRTPPMRDRAVERLLASGQQKHHHMLY